MICNNILEAMGNTPLIRLNRITDDDSAEILVKFEGLNVGGSIKTRTAFNMIRDAEEKGLINKDTIIVEPTSGNQGIGIALVAAVRGYRVKIIMPDSVSEERRKLVRQYGADVVLIHDRGDIGECIRECLSVAMQMQKDHPNVFVPHQFENPANPAIQKDGTGAEILQQVNRPIHGFCSGADSKFAHYPYHGYYGIDYTNMDANMGTKEEFKDLPYVILGHSMGSFMTQTILQKYPKISRHHQLHSY